MLRRGFDLFAQLLRCRMIGVDDGFSELEPIEANLSCEGTYLGIEGSTVKFKYLVQPPTDPTNLSPECSPCWAIQHSLYTSHER